MRSAATAGGFLPADFWERHVLQVAYSEPAVRTATTALGALHRSWELLTIDMTTSTTDSTVTRASHLLESARFASLAVDFYSRALRLGRAVQTTTSMLVLSLVLAAVSNFTGRWADSRMHIASGQRLLSQIRVNGGMTDETSCVADSLARLQLQGEAFSDDTAPYLYHDTDVFDEDLAKPQNMSFESLNESATHLYKMGGRIAVLAERYTDKDLSAEDAAREREIAQQMKAWETSFGSYLNRLEPAEFQKQELALLAIKLLHAQGRMWLRAGFSGPETRWDACLPHFERIIALSSTLLYRTRPLAPSAVSVDMGLVMPLYVSASRCRHPALRRRLITLLHNSNRNEGMWNSFALTTAAMKIAMLEEEGLGINAPLVIYLNPSEVQAWANQVCTEGLQDWLEEDKAWEAQTSWEGIPMVPEDQRIIELHHVVDYDARVTHLTAIYSGRDENGAFRTAQSTSEFVGPALLSASSS